MREQVALNETPEKLEPRSASGFAQRSGDDGAFTLSGLEMRQRDTFPGKPRLFVLNPQALQDEHRQRDKVFRFVEKYRVMPVFL